MTNPNGNINLKEFHWFNEPGVFSLTESSLSMRTNGKTDFWQRTHYGFQRDDGHCLLKSVKGDFTIQVETQFKPEAQYDQCGLFVRIDQDNWIKCSTEFEDDQKSRLGSVVTNMGYSDWSSQDIHSKNSSMWYRLSRSGKDFYIENSFCGEYWYQMRMTHLHNAADEIEVGLYACSPIGEGFNCSFENLTLDENQWVGH